MNQIPEGPPTLPPGAEATRTESGLEFVEIEAGGEPHGHLDSRVQVHYRCWLTEGSLIEDTHADGMPAEVVLGQGDATAGLEEGLLGLGPGARRRLIVPSDLAYGGRGSGTRVPPYATLIYDVEVLAVS